MKKLLTVLLAVIMTAGLAACGGGGEGSSSIPPAETSTPRSQSSDISEPAAPAASDIKLSYACWNLQNEWFISLVKGFEDACAELGVESVVTNSQFQLEKQINDIENLVNSGVNGVAFAAVDETATHDIVENAKAKGVIVASTAQIQSNANFMYALDEYEYGRIIGENAANWVNEQLGGKGKYVLLAKDDIDTTIARGDGIQEALEKLCPDLIQVSRQTADTAETAYSIVESVLQTDPDINLIVGTEDSSVIGGYRAMQAAGISGDDRAAFSGDATSEILAAMREDGSFYRGTVDLIPYQCGYEVAMKMYDYVVNGAPAEPEELWFQPEAITQQALLDGTYNPVG